MTREVVWDYRWKGRKLCSTLPRVVGAERFRYVMEGDESNDLSKKPAQKLMKDYQYHFHNGVRRQQPQQYALYGSRRQFTQWVFDRPLKEMTLAIYMFSPDEFSRFPYPPTLTTLKIEMGYSVQNSFNLGMILKALPLLEHFHGVKGDRWYISGPWVPQDWDRQKPLRLQTLELYYASFWQEDLEDLLTIAPDLKVMKLVGVTPSQFRSNPPGGDDDIMKYNRRRLFQHLKALSFTLDMFHFSIGTYSLDDDGSDDEGFNLMARELCPKLSEWSLWSPVVTPTLLRELEDLPNVVTRLELSWAEKELLDILPCKFRNQWSAPRLLHQYLCASPHLLHLRTMQIQYMIEGMDLGRRASFRDLSPLDYYAWTYRQSQGSIRPGIWACRKLRVLEMELHDHNDGDVQLTSPVLSRILFGYLSRVCPRLEEVDIRVPWCCLGSMSGPSYSPRLYTQLHGGLCLLSRLTNLRMLRVCPDSLAEGHNTNKVDFAWMTSGGHTEKERRRRRVVMVSWEGMLAQEERLENDRCQSDAVRETPLASETAPLDGDILWQLKDLGRLSEVKAVLEGMDKDGFRCLQQLTQFALGPTLGQRPEDVLKRLFPQKFFR